MELITDSGIGVYRETGRGGRVAWWPNFVRNYCASDLMMLRLISAASPLRSHSQLFRTAGVSYVNAARLTKRIPLSPYTFPKRAKVRLVDARIHVA